MLEHNEKWQNIICSFCVPENVRTVIKRESDGPDPFKKLRTVEKVLFIEKKVNKLESQFFTERKDTLNFVIEENLNWNSKDAWKSFTTCTVWIEWKT